MEDIYIGTPSKDEIRRYWNRTANNQPSDMRSEGDRSVEFSSSEDELSESFEEFLKKSAADRKNAKGVAIASALEDPTVIKDVEMTLEHGAELAITSESANIADETEIAMKEAEAIITPFELQEDFQTAKDDSVISNEDTDFPWTSGHSAIFEQPEESAMEDVDVTTTPDDSPTVASKNWIVNSSIVIATPTVGDRKMFLQRCFKESSKNASAFDVRPSFGAFIQKKKQQLEKPKTIVEGEAEGSSDM